MDIATGIGLIGGVATVIVLILIDGGNFAGYFDKHAVIVIFGGATAATMVRFPFSVILHGLPMGLKFAFTLRSSDPRALIEEITQIAEVVRKNGPMALENVQKPLDGVARAVQDVPVPHRFAPSPPVRPTSSSARRIIRFRFAGVSSVHPVRCRMPWASRRASSFSKLCPTCSACRAAVSAEIATSPSSGAVPAGLKS